MEKQKKVPKRGRPGVKGFKELNDGPKLPRSVKMAPGSGGARNKSKLANLDELDMLHHAAINQINDYNHTTELPTGGSVSPHCLSGLTARLDCLLLLDDSSSCWLQISSLLCVLLTLCSVQVVSMRS